MERDHLGDLSINGKKLRWTVREQGTRSWTRFSKPRCHLTQGWV